MTTIAYDGRYVSIDSQVTAGAVKFCEKKWYEGVTAEGDSFVLFAAGTVSDIQALVREIEQGGLRNIPEGDYVAILLTGDPNPILLEGDGGRVEIRHSLYACGSGQAAALVALVDGHSAPEAILLASKVDLYTGGPVHTYDTQRRAWCRPRTK